MHRTAAHINDRFRPDSPEAGGPCRSGSEPKPSKWDSSRGSEARPTYAPADSIRVSSQVPEVLSRKLPQRIEELPPAIVVDETEMGRATGQWIVEIRCECGRGWFDVEMVKTARCPAAR